MSESCWAHTKISVTVRLATFGVTFSARLINISDGSLQTTCAQDIIALQEASDSGAVPERQAVGAAGAAKQPAGLLLPRAKGRPRKLAHQPEGQPMHQQQQAIQAQYGHQQAQPAQAAKWQSDMNPPQLYAMAHNSARAVGGPSSMLVQQPQLQFRQLLSRPATASTRISSGANLGASSASLDEEEYPNSASQQQQQQHQAGVQSTAQGSAATAVAASSGGGSLYACTPPGRTPGRRLAVVRWVLNQRALWREGQLTPVQIQYMTILGLFTSPQNLRFPQSYVVHHDSTLLCVVNYVGCLGCPAAYIGVYCLPAIALTKMLNTDKCFHQSLQ